MRNWAGNVTFSASEVARPVDLDELRRTVAAASRVHAVGSRHSFSTVADTPGTLISLEDMPPAVEIDSAARQARVAAALRYGELVPALDEAGLAVPNLASLPHISVVGACATGTHGSGDGNQGLAASVAGFDLVTASGDVVTLDRSADGFEGSVVSLGALGVATSVTLDLVPSFTVRQWVYDGLPAASLAEQIFASAYSVSVFTTWRDPSVFDQVWIKAASGWESAPPTWHGARLADGPRHPVPGMPVEYANQQGGVPGPWHARLPHFRAEFTPSAGEEIQSEYLVPRSYLTDAVAAIAPLAPRIAPLLLISEIRSVAADSLWLSPAYQRDTIGLHFTWHQDPAVSQVLPLIESALAPFEPRAHWGKVFSPSMGFPYPRLADFAALADRYDPGGKFRNSFTERALAGQ
ncbi:MAG: FAD-binding protein [Streptosporangiaceae bacterium]